MAKRVGSYKNKKRKTSSYFKSIFSKINRSRSARLELKVAKKKLVTGGSDFVVAVSKRDESEVNGALGSLGGKSIADIREKYKKFSEVV